MRQLDRDSLATLPVGLARPAYDRDLLRTGIVHFGVGGFHRAHQAAYLDELMGKKADASDWGVCGVGVMPADQRMRDALKSQDCLYTMVVKRPDGRRDARVIGSIADYRYAPDDPDAVIEQMAAPTTRIVSLTITEGGYNIDYGTGRFNLDDPGVRQDLHAGAAPCTVFGLATEALRRRRSRGVIPFTVMSCDNIQSNGDIARKSFGAFASAVDPAFGEWVREAVAFPNAMVDRITPVTTDEDISELAGDYGVADRWPVICEPFRQWVLEDHFPAGRPAWEEVGVQMVADVTPYESMKLHLLNGSHQVIAYFGMLAGYCYVHEAAHDPTFTHFLLDYMIEEVTPVLAPVPGVDLNAYRRTLIDRLSNPMIRDTLARIGAETSDRIPKFVLPVIRKQLAAGGEIRRGAAVIASWARYVEGKDDQGRPLEIVDRLKDRLLAAADNTNPEAFIADQSLFGDLADQPRFVAAYREALASLHAVGAIETMKRYR